MSLRLTRYASQWSFRLRGPCQPASSDVLPRFPVTLAEPERALGPGMEASTGVSSLLRGLASVGSGHSRSPLHYPSTAGAAVWHENRSCLGLSSGSTQLQSAGLAPNLLLSLEAAAAQSPKASAASGQPALATTEEQEVPFVRRQL